MKAAIRLGSIVPWALSAGAGCSEHGRAAPSDIADAGDGGHAGGQVPAAAGAGGAQAGAGGQSACASDADASPLCREEQSRICGQLNPGRCEDHAFCQSLRGRRILERDLTCVTTEIQDVGCGLLGCGSLYTVARDPSGGLWLFPTTCIPPGWTAVDSGVPEECGTAGAGGAG